MKKISLMIALLIVCSHINAQVTLIDSFMHGGLMRTYRLYIPAVYTGSSAVPVVLNLHGYTSNGLQQELYGDFRSIADTANFIIAHPDGTFDANNLRFWNVFGLSPVDDIGFLSALLDTIIANYNINQNRIYSTGMSNGGYMSYQLACSLSDRITAVASVTGTMTIDMRNNCSPTHPVPAMQIHGTADAVVPYAGAGVNLAIDTVVKHWVDFNHCNPVPVFTAVPDVVPGDGCTAEHYVYNGGDAGSTVEFYKVIGGAHTWPGAPFVVGVTNMDFSASQQIWRFFSKYSLNTLATNTSEVIHQENNEVFIYPNPSTKDVTLRFNNQNQREVLIYNAVGQNIFTGSANELLFNIDLNVKGMYFLYIKENTKSTAHKILIQ